VVAEGLVFLRSQSKSKVALGRHNVEVVWYWCRRYNQAIKLTSVPALIFVVRYANKKRASTAAVYARR
jgi:hypothetical protein